MQIDGIFLFVDPQVFRGSWDRVGWGGGGRVGEDTYHHRAAREGLGERQEDPLWVL